MKEAGAMAAEWARVNVLRMLATAIGIAMVWPYLLHLAFLIRQALGRATNGQERERAIALRALQERCVACRLENMFVGWVRLCPHNVVFWGGFHRQKLKFRRCARIAWGFGWHRFQAPLFAEMRWKDKKFMRYVRTWTARRRWRCCCARQDNGP